jgi:hypothetical protein
MTECVICCRRVLQDEMIRINDVVHEVCVTCLSKYLK